MTKPTPTKSSKKSKDKKQPPQPKMKKQLRPRGNPDLQAYLRLLGDPCNADLTHPPYEGVGSGVLMRTRNMIPIAATNTAAAIALQPGGLNYGPIVWRGVDIATNPINGSPITVNTAAQNTALFAQFRLVAACIKVHYTGTELARQGSVYTGIHTEGVFSTTGFLNGTTASTYATMGQKVSRLGSEMHEVRYVPTNIEDQQFWGQQNAGTANETIGGTVITAVVDGVPAGTVMFEVVCVWECRLNMTAAGTGMPDVVGKSSTFKLHDALAFIGDVATFAVRAMGGPTMQGLARNVAVPMLEAFGGGQRRVKYLTG